MPWSPKDAHAHTKKASTPTTQRQWAHVANAVLKKTGSEAKAVKQANAAVAHSKGSGKGK